MATDFPEIVVRNYAELVDAFARVKNYLQLSHETVEAIAGLARGHFDKMIGPKREKTIGPRSLDLLLGAMGLQLRVEVDPEQAQLVASRWERRNNKQVRIRPSPPISAELLEHAKQIIFSAYARKANASRTPEKRSRIARIAGIASGKARRQAQRRQANGHANGLAAAK
jgi:hypothetical protein